jgi:pyruvate/2-oxoglutarate/acetoin dehydrogenase E1 component
MKYKEELIRAMDYLATDKRTIFLGQSVVWPGNSIFGTLVNVPADQKVEMPVFEETQLGLSTGLALSGYVPISIFPRFNFLILTLNQLVNHLDKFPAITRGAVTPRVIIRTSIGSIRPLFPGYQHSGDYTEAFKALGLENIDIVRLEEPEEIFPAFKKALERKDGKSTLLIEYGDYYNEK